MMSIRRTMAGIRGYSQKEDTALGKTSRRSAQEWRPRRVQGSVFGGASPPGEASTSLSVRLRFPLLLHALPLLGSHFFPFGLPVALRHHALRSARSRAGSEPAATGHEALHDARRAFEAAARNRRRASFGSLQLPLGPAGLRTDRFGSVKVSGLGSAGVPHLIFLGEELCRVQDDFFVLP